MSEEVVLRAQSLVGCPFRAQGRDPELGLDCVGVICATFGIPVDLVPRNYRLRGGGLERLKGEMARFFRRVRTPAAGDVLIFKVGAEQLHLGILSDRGLIHADAGVRKVVETPGAPRWPVLSAHRRKG